MTNLYLFISRNNFLTKLLLVFCLDLYVIISFRINNVLLFLVSFCFLAIVISLVMRIISSLIYDDIQRALINTTFALKLERNIFRNRLLLCVSPFFILPLLSALLITFPSFVNKLLLIGVLIWIFVNIIRQLQHLTQFKIGYQYLIFIFFKNVVLISIASWLMFFFNLSLLL